MQEIEKKVNIALLKLLSKALFGEEFDIELTSEELALLFEESRHQTIAAITFDVLPSKYSEVNPEIYQRWQNYSMNVLSNNVKNLFENAALTKLLSDAKIKHSTIKGFSSAQYYPKPYLRQMGDIDFLVDKDDVSKTIELLEQEGFIKNDSDHKFHIGFRKNKTVYELHTQISFVPTGKEDVLLFTEKIIPNSIKKRINGFDIIVPDIFSHGMIMLFHMQRHIEQGEGIGLRHLCDWAVFVNSLGNQKFVYTFEQKLKNIGLWKFARILTQICIKYLNMSFQDWVNPMDNDLSESLLDDFLQSGNFGFKDITRSQSSIFVNRSSEKKSYFKVVLASLKRKIMAWKPLCKKHEWLIPFAAVVYFFRILFQAISGRKFMKISDLIKKGKHRNQTYSELNFFDYDNDKKKN